MKRVLLLQAILLLFVSCDKFEGLFDDGEKYVAPELVIGEVTDNSVEISLIRQDENSDAESGVCYATHPSPTIDDGMYNYDGSPRVLEGLSPQTLYYVRSYITGGDEKVFYGSILTFTTAEERPKAFLEGFVNYAQSLWAHIRIAGSGAAEVGVCLGVSSEPTVKNFTKKATYDPAEGLWSVTVNGLNESTCYYLRAYVKTEKGEVFYSRDQMEFSTDGAYCPDMGIVIPIRREDTYADLTYYVNESNIIRRGVCWATHPEPTLEDNKTVDESVEGDIDIRLEGLEPATLYYIRPYVVLSHPYEGEKVYYGMEADFTTYELNEFFGIPDENFKLYLVSEFDRNGDGRVSKREARNVSIMEIPSGNIASLEGIENFPNLGVLYCEDNRITFLDLSANTSLRDLRCNKNEITRLELGSSFLEVLECNNNLLTELDVSRFSLLARLEFTSNKLRKIDLSGNPNLFYLLCDDNPLQELQLGANPLLEDLFCYDCKLTGLDLSANPKLTRVWCHRNELASLNLAGCTLLTNLNCSQNSLTVLNVDDCTRMENLDCRDNETIETLDLSRCKKLKELDCSGNKIRTLDLSGNANLTRVWCDDNALGSLDITGCSKLGYLRCEDNNLAFLSVRDLVRLERLVCYNNSLTAIDLKGAKQLQLLNCTNNSLGALDVSDNSYLEYLYCGKNNITTLDLSNNPDLKPENLLCDSNVNVIWK